MYLLITKHFKRTNPLPNLWASFLLLNSNSQEVIDTKSILFLRKRQFDAGRKTSDIMNVPCVSKNPYKQKVLL